MTIARLFSAPVIPLFICLLMSFQLSVAGADEVPAMPAVRAIAIAPALPVEKYSIENRGGVLDLFAGAGWLIQKNIEGGRIAEFRNLLSGNSFNAPEELALATIAALKENLQSASLGKEIRYAEDDPGAIDFKRSKTESDTVLVITIFNMGLASNRFTTKFVPRVNVTFDLIDVRTEESVYSQSIYYGADANKNAEDQIIADVRYGYDSFESAIAGNKELVEAYREGLRKIAGHAATQIKNLQPMAATRSN